MMESGFCVRALERALRHGQPEIFNTDQGSQFTGNDFTGVENVTDLMTGLKWWLSFYNEERPHTSLPGSITPHEMYESHLNL